MADDNSDIAIRFRDSYQPHWVWATALVLVPFVLIGLSFLGLERGSMISSTVAATAPKVALLISAGGMGAALVRRRRVPIAFAGIGCCSSAVGVSSIFLAQSIAPFDIDGGAFAIRRSPCRRYGLFFSTINEPEWIDQSQT